MLSRHCVISAHLTRSNEIAIGTLGGMVTKKCDHREGTALGFEAGVAGWYGDCSWPGGTKSAGTTSEMTGIWPGMGLCGVMTGIWPGMGLCTVSD